MILLYQLLHRPGQALQLSLLYVSACQDDATAAKISYV